MADSSRISILRGTGYETIHQSAQQNELADRKSGDSNNRWSTRILGEHPIRNLVRATVWLSNQEIAASIMLMITNHQHCLADQRMKRIGDHSFERQKPSTMAPARTAERVTGRSP